MNTAKKTVVPLSKRYFTWATKHFDEIHTISLHKVHLGYSAKNIQKYNYTQNFCIKLTLVIVQASLRCQGSQSSQIGHMVALPTTPSQISLRVN